MDTRSRARGRSIHKTQEAKQGWGMIYRIRGVRPGMFYIHDTQIQAGWEWRGRRVCIWAT